MVLTKPKWTRSKRFSFLRGRFWGDTTWDEVFKKLSRLNAVSYQATEKEMAVHQIQCSMAQDLQPHVKSHVDGLDVKSIVLVKLEQMQPSVESELKKTALHFKREELKIVEDLCKKLRKEIQEMSGGDIDPATKRVMELTDAIERGSERRAAG